MFRGGPTCASDKERESRTPLSRAKKVSESLASIQKKYNQAKGQQGFNYEEALEQLTLRMEGVPPTIVVPNVVSEVATFIQLLQ